MNKVSIEKAKDTGKYFARFGTEVISGTDSDSIDEVKKKASAYLKRVYKYEDSEIEFVVKNSLPIKNDFSNLNGDKFFGGFKIENGLSSDQIERLKQEYGKLDKIDPSTDAYKKLESFMSGLDQEALVELAKANIKFVSTLARNRVKDKSKL